MDWLLSLLTLTMMWLVGNKNRWGWAVGLANQGLWVWFAVSKHSYGLLLLAAALTVMYARNLWKWAQEAREAADPPYTWPDFPKQPGFQERRTSPDDPGRAK